MESATRSRLLARRGVVGTALMLGCLATVPAAAGDQPAGRGLPVLGTHSALSAIQSLGVNVHLSYSRSAYGHFTRVEHLIHRLGARHVRDSLTLKSSNQTAELRTLGRQGIRSDLILRGPSRSRHQEIHKSQLHRLRGPLRASVETVEDTNEYDCSGDPSWPRNLRNFSQLLRSRIRALNGLNDIPIVGPSFCRLDDAKRYGPLAGTADVANIHNYPGGAPPEFSVETRIAQAAHWSGKGIVLVTEAGYQTGRLPVNGQPPASLGRSAVYLERLFLDDLRVGVARTYIYELLDEARKAGAGHGPGHFGLVHYNGKPKPAYVVLRRLIRDLARGNPWQVTSGGGPASRRIGVSTAAPNLRYVVVNDPAGHGATVAMWLTGPDLTVTRHHPAVVQLAVPHSVRATRRIPSANNTVHSMGVASHFTVRVGPEVTLIHLGG